ncbi:MAG TPA: hypothetical protein VFW44_20180 [Bryobacteraceae bacterium]|nr:hypothetical protein [Bryobacteraceae bacterium]
MSSPNDLLDRYIHRDLDAAAARGLAQSALDDADLFEELTAIALAEAALASPATADRALAQAALDNEELFDTLVARGLADIARPPEPRKRRWPIAAASAVAAIAAGLITFFILRPSPAPKPSPVAVVSNPAPAIRLTAELRPPVSASGPTFRGDNSASRAPKSEGTIVSIEDGLPTIDLGAIDGIQKGQEIGGIRITTVFRDRARGTILDPALRAHATVTVPAEIHLRAVLAEINALAASGNLSAARDLARNSLSNGSPGATRPLLERLAALDYQAGAADAAREHYEVAVNNFDQPPAASPGERASTLASYGTLCLLHGDLQLGRALLGQALAQQPSAADRAVIEANLARLDQQQPR